MGQSPSRSRRYQAYLDTQSRERVIELVAAERAYDRSQIAARVAEDPAESDYVESFFGYEDPPAGITNAHRAVDFDPAFRPGVGGLTRYE